MCKERNWQYYEQNATKAREIQVKISYISNQFFLATRLTGWRRNLDIAPIAPMVSFTSHNIFFFYTTQEQIYLLSPLCSQLTNILPNLYFEDQTKNISVSSSHRRCKSLLFSLGLGQNLVWPKAEHYQLLTHHHHHHPPPPTENFSKGSRLRMGPRFCM